MTQGLVLTEDTKMVDFGSILGTMGGAAAQAGIGALINGGGGGTSGTGGTAGFDPVGSANEGQAFAMQMYEAGQIDKRTTQIGQLTAAEGARSTAQNANVTSMLQGLTARAVGLSDALKDSARDTKSGMSLRT
jgi:hypothetical protein